MKNGYKLEDKCLRNELLILINYLMNDRTCLPFFHLKPVDLSTSPTTFLDILLFYSTIDEMTFYNESIRTNNLRSYFSTNSEVFFKQIYIIK